VNGTAAFPQGRDAPPVVQGEDLREDAERDLLRRLRAEVDPDRSEETRALAVAELDAVARQVGEQPVRSRARPEQADVPGRCLKQRAEQG
jgi:hypothetical protein